MGALLSKSTGSGAGSADKPSKAGKSKRQPAPTKLNPGPHLNRSADNNTTDMTTLPEDEDESRQLADAGGDLNCSSVTMHTASDVSFAIVTEPATPVAPVVAAAALHFIDPRSPFVCRTPLQALANGSPTSADHSYTITKQLNLSDPVQQQLTPVAATNWLAGGQNTFVQQKLLKNLGYQEFDPRSPTQFINRTPMRLATAEQKTNVSVVAAADVQEGGAEVAYAALSESISSVATDADVANTERETEMLPLPEVVPSVDDAVSVKALPDVSPAKTPAAVGVDDCCDSDPRSPSTNVDRTPIVLLNAAEDCENQPAANSEIAAAKVANTANQSSIQIFEDDAVIASSTMLSTPAKAVLGSAKKAAGENPRTPLSCLGNQKGLGRIAAGAAAASGRKPQHPILFIGKHQSAAAAAARNGGDSRIPVLKSTGATGGNSMLKM